MKPYWKGHNFHKNAINFQFSGINFPKGGLFPTQSDLHEIIIV